MWQQQGSVPVLEARGKTGTVRFDGRVVTIVRGSALHRVNLGGGERQLLVGQLLGVGWKAPSLLLGGWIRFELPGSGPEPRGATAAAKDRDSVVFWRGQLAQFEALRAAVVGVLAAR